MTGARTIAGQVRGFTRDRERENENTIFSGRGIRVRDLSILGKKLR